jgi:hypothetical protein
MNYKMLQALYSFFKSMSKEIANYFCNFKSVFYFYPHKIN